MKILVTGANGYIGMGVVRHLLEQGAYVVATDLKNENISSSAEFVKADLFDVVSAFEVMGRPDRIVHLAWRDGFKHDSQVHLADLDKHYHFLKGMMESGVKQVTVMGSVHEIGFFEGSVNEHTPTNPQSLYGISKNALRSATELCAKQRDVVFQWLRGYYIVGNAEHGCSIFSKITQAAMRGEREFPFTMGLNQFDFIEYEAFCEQVARTAMQDSINGIINCCSGRPMRLSERVEDFIKENHYDIKLRYGTFPDRSYDSKAIWGDDRKIRKIMRGGI